MNNSFVAGRIKNETGALLAGKAPQQLKWDILMKISFCSL